MGESKKGIGLTEGRVIFWVSLAALAIMVWAAWLWQPWVGILYGLAVIGLCLGTRVKFCRGCRNRCPFNPNLKQGVLLPFSGSCHGLTKGEGWLYKWLSYILLLFGFYAVYRWLPLMAIGIILFTLWMWYGVYRPRVCGNCENTCPWNPDLARRP